MADYRSSNFARENYAPHLRQGLSSQAQARDLAHTRRLPNAASTTIAQSRDPSPSSRFGMTGASFLFALTSFCTAAGLATNERDHDTLYPEVVSGALVRVARVFGAQIRPAVFGEDTFQCCLPIN